jgi:hypothetical protein
LEVRLEVTGARVEATMHGAQLVLEKSGRRIAYSRLRATDATGKELPARIEVGRVTPCAPSACKSRSVLSGIGAHGVTRPTLAIFVNDTGAVYPVRIDPTFSDANWVSIGGVNGSVYAAVTDGSGNLYVGGAFATAGGTNASNIAQWNGGGWSALGSGMNATVSALTVAGGTLYAGGFFTTAGGTAANKIAQWNGNSWSALGSGMNNGVLALAASGGTLYAGGAFTMAGGTNANYMAQWNGSSWSPLGSGVNSNVYALAVPDDTLYAGGRFTTAGGKASSSIVEAYLVAPPGGIADSISTPSSGIANVKFYGNPGQQFGVQRTSNLSALGWTTVNSIPLIPAADGSFTFVDTNAPAPSAYYRAFQY